MRERARRDPLRPALIGLAAAQALTPLLARVTPFGATEEERARADQGPVTPTGGAFAIWGPLFAASLSYARRATGPEAARRPEARTVAALMAATYAATTAWSLNAQLRGLGRASVALITAAAGTSAAALRVASRAGAVDAQARADANRIGGLAGWLAVAGFANLETTLNRRRGRPAVPARRAVALLSAAAATGAGLTAASRANPALVGAVGWGLGGVLVKAVREGERAVAATAALGLAGLGATAAATTRATRLRR